MNDRRTWDPPKPTRVRLALDYLERVRYRMVYRSRLKGFLRARPDVAAYRLSSSMRRDIRGYWSKFGLTPPHADWFRLFYALTGRQDPRFIPEETFRVELERWINTQSLADAYSDKNLLDKRFPDAVRPEAVLRRMHGRYYSGQYAPLTRESAAQLLRKLNGPFIVKPSIGDTGSGQNVNLITIADDSIHADRRSIELADIEVPYGGNFIIQRQVRQHGSMAAYHNDSLNTCRIITLRVRDEYKVIGATFRMGNGSYVDNGHAGGLLCGVGIESGELNATAVDVVFREHLRHPRTGVCFAGRTIEHFDDMKNLALSLHRTLVYFDMVSFDIGLDADAAPCLIEVNLWGQGIEPHQVLKGSPLFGDDTDEMLALVAARRNRVWA